MDEFFYGTLPQDTQDFSQVLRGVGRSIGDISRGVSYYPYDLVGAPVDLINMALTPVGLGSEQPVLGSDYLRNIAQSLGFAQPSTGSGAETAGRFGAAFVNPAAGARAVGQLSQGVTRGANLSADRLVQMITGNPQATAPRVLEETSMPFMQAVAPKTPAVPGLMEPAKSDIGFYSQLEAATIPLQSKGTGDQYLAQIQKSAGVKPEEIQWTGLDEFLKGKKSVTKTEIQDYLQANRVDIQEVRLDRTPAMVGAERNAAYDAYDRGEITLEQRNAILERSDPTTTRHHLGAYQGIKTEIPGGENYREILLTLPNQWEKPRALQEANSKRIRELKEQMWGTSGSDEIRSEISRLHRENTLLQQQISDAPIYKSSHFDQPNILAHMRVNDRVVDGKKTLFIEEVQSDWHQAGRKKGYATGTEEKAYVDYLKDLEVRAKNDIVSNFISDGATPERAEILANNLVKGLADDPRKLAAYFGEEAKQMELHQARLAAREGVPDAPFKTSWHELTLKRAIQEASEKGYDQIAFTTGKTQAERYDLSKQVEAIRVNLNQDGTYQIGVKPPGQNMQRLDSSVPQDKLSEMVGKDLAEKISKEVTQPGVDSGKVFSGLDLQIGGEGMKGFYDNILPKSLEKLGKKFDAKVGKTFIEGERTRDADGFPSMYPEKIEVWKMDITPKMRESVTTKGQPLFAIPAVGAGLLGAGMYQDEQMF
jgi:hypothetical protein